MNIRNNLLVLVAALAICGATAASHATTNIVSVEIGIEASTDMTTLPVTNTGAIVLSCATCRPRSYHVTPQTTYFVGTATVTLAQLNAFVVSGGHPHRRIRSIDLPEASLTCADGDCMSDHPKDLL
jgi:hypothetical protein